MFAYTASGSRTQKTSYIHFGGRLGKGEIRRSETNLYRRPKQKGCKIVQDFFEVGKADILIDVQTFDLVELHMGSGRNRFVAVNPARRNSAQWQLSLHHFLDLHGRGMGPQQISRIQGHKESVLHIPSRMVCAKMEGLKIVPIVHQFGAIGPTKAQFAEEIEHEVAGEGQGVSGAPSPNGRGQRGEVGSFGGPLA